MPKVHRLARAAAGARAGVDRTLVTAQVDDFTATCAR
jgi:hypothetical protein